jgi:DNA-binding CsgD family transcriptional regulator
VLIRGPAGVGKSTLLGDVRGSQHSQEMTVLHAVCGETAGGYGAVRDLFAALGLTSDDAADSPLLQGPARGALPALLPDASRTDAEPEMYAVLIGLYWLTVNVMADRPLMIVLDDVHRADARSLRWVDFLLRRSADLPLLVLLAERTGTFESPESVLAEIAGNSRCHIMELAPLSEVDIAAMVEHMLGDPPAPAFQRFCTQVSGGNPLVLSRLLAELRLRGLRPDETATARVEKVGREAIAASVSVRLDALPGYVREVATAVAVLGETDMGLLGVLSGVLASRVSTALDALQRNDILAPGGERFAHELVRAAVLAEVPGERLEQFHAKAARLLNDSGRPTDEVAAQILQLPKPNEPWMLHVLQDAARQAEQRGAPEVAARYLERVRDHDPDDVGVDLWLAKALANVDPGAAMRSIEEVLGRISDPRTRASTAQHVAMISLAAQESTHGFRLTERILDELNAEIGDNPGDADRELRMFVESNLLAAGIERRSTVAQTQARARTIPAPSGDSPNERQLLGLLAVMTAMEGRSAERALEYARRVLRIQELTHTGLAQFSASFAAALADEKEMALGGLDWVLADSHRRGAAWTRCRILALRSFVLESTGAIDGGLADAWEAMEIAEQEKWGRAAVWAPISLAMVLIKMGKPEQADAVLDMIDTAVVQELTWQHPSFLLTRGHARWVVGDLENALDYMVRSGESLEQGGIRNPVYLPWWMDATCVLADLDKTADAMPFVEHGEELVRSWNTSRSAGFGLLARGLVTPGRQGVHLLGDAVAALAASPAKSYEARAECLFGRALLRVEDTRGARKHLRRAIDLSVRHGCRAIAGVARELLLSAGGRMPVLPSSPADGLTDSERRVVTLATEGLSNREIAEYLFVTVRTVEEHITRAFHKLGVSSRAELPSAMNPGLPTVQYPADNADARHEP